MSLTHRNLGYLYMALTALCFILGLVFVIQLDHQSKGHLPQIIDYISMPIFPISLAGIIWLVAVKRANPIAVMNNHYFMWVPGIMVFAISISLYLIALSFLQDRYLNVASEALRIARRFMLAKCSIGSLSAATVWHVLCYKSSSASNKTNNE